MLISFRGKNKFLLDMHFNAEKYMSWALKKRTILNRSLKLDYVTGLCIAESYVVQYSHHGDFKWLLYSQSDIYCFRKCSKIPHSGLKIFLAFTKKASKIPHEVFFQNMRNLSHETIQYFISCDMQWDGEHLEPLSVFIGNKEIKWFKP